MKSLLIAAVLLAAGSTASAQTSVHLNIGQPGFYGQIDIGDYRPPVVYERPIIIERPYRYVAEPLYLRVPPGQMRDWRKHCRHYNACGRQVYFVRDDWYENTYAPRYREQHHYAPGPVYVQQRHEERGYQRDDDDDHGHGHGRGHDEGHGGGHGEGHGHGHGHGKD